MTQYAPFDNTSIREAHAAYLKKAIASGNLMPLDYSRWLERENAALQAKIDAALAIQSSGDKPAYAWEAGWDACRDEFRAALGAVK